LRLSFSVTPSPPAGMLDVTNPPGGLTAATGDGTTDDTSAIQRILNYTKTTSNKKIFFPQGKYLINDDIDIPDEVELHGSEDDISVITTSSPRFTHKLKNTLPVSNVRLENLYFDGIRLKLRQSLSRDITVKRCVFFCHKANPGGSGANVADEQLKFDKIERLRIEECVFLRDSNAFGIGIQFYGTRRVVVTNNIFGLDLNDITWLSGELKLPYWTKQERKLTLLKTDFSLPNDQGFFKSAFYDAYDTLMTIAKNVFNRSPNNSSAANNHVVYLKGFSGMIITSNYARGWPNNGGIKIQNGQHIHIARNYLDDTGILLYTHDPRAASPYGGLKDVIIYGNHIVVRSNDATGITYFKPHWKQDSGLDENIQYAANEFEFPGVSNPSATCINLTNGDLTQHHVYEDNVYYGTTPPKTITLSGRHTATPFSWGCIDPVISTLYNYDPYKLNIPPYS